MNNVKPLSEQQALEAIRTAPVAQPVLVDFDETLLLRNSTEEYLSSLSPQWLAGLVLYVLNVFLNHFPLSDFSKTRDWYRVFACTLLFPWSPFIWRYKAKKVGKAHHNKALIDAIHSKERNETIIVSAGYTFIIKPLLEAMQLGTKPVIACGFWQGRAFLKNGKHSHPQVAKLLDASLFITDSIADKNELERAATPVYVKWQSARYIPALTHTYIPLWYTEKIKRPNQRFLFRSVLQDDFCFWLLAAVWADQYGWQLLGMLLLLISFWVIYELGYRENDKSGFLYEESPKLSEAFFNRDLRESPRYAPWLFALSVGFLGIAALNQLNAHHDDTTWLSIACLLWAAVLISTRGIYYLYNKLTIKQRVFVYPILQILRNFSFVILVPITAGGAALLAANTIASSATYLVYRLENRSSWPDIPVASLRLLIISSLLIVITLVGSMHDNPHTPAYLAITIWCLYRSKQDWKGLLKQYLANR